METGNKMETECMTSALDLFTKAPVQRNIFKTQTIVYNPITALGNSQSIDFHIPSNGEKIKPLTS